MQEAGITLELSRDLDYDGVAAALTEALRKAGEAEALGLEDPALLRFTAQQPFVNQPKPQPLKFHGFDTLYSIMSHYNTILETVFYEVLDIPLRDLEQLKTLKVRRSPPRTMTKTLLTLLSAPNQCSRDYRALRTVHQQAVNTTVNSSTLCVCSCPHDGNVTPGIGFSFEGQVLRHGVDKMESGCR